MRVKLDGSQKINTFFCTISFSSSKKMGHTSPKKRPAIVAMAAQTPPRKVGRPRKLKIRPPKLQNLTTKDELNAAISIMHASGSSIRDIAASTGVHRSVVARMGFVTPTKRANRVSQSPNSTPSPVVKHRRKAVARCHAKNPRATSSEIVWQLAQKGTHVSKRTVQRDQRALGGRHLTCERVQRLTDADTKKRA